MERWWVGMLRRKLFIVGETNLKNVCVASLYLNYVSNHETVMGKQVTNEAFF